MHIAFLTPEFPHKELNHSAGLGTSIYNMSVSLVRAGVQVSVIAYSQNKDTHFEYEGIRIYALKHNKYTYLGWYLYRKKIQQFLNQLVISEKIDLIEAPDWTGITAFMKFKVPHIIRLHGSDTFFCNLEGRTVKRKNYLFERKALQKATAIVGVSSFVKEETERLFRLPISGPVIPNGIDVDAFVNPYPEKYDKNTLLYFGTIIRKKGVLELAKIFNLVVEKNPEAKLILLGNDNFDVKTGRSSTYQLMKELFTESALEKVSYLGKVPYDQVKKYILSAHVCVFPSLAESFGMVTIEAMALNKAVVNSDYGWSRDIIDNGVQGFLEDPKKTKKFAERIDALLSDDSLLKRMAEQGRIRVEERFSIKNLSQDNIKFYKQVIDGIKAN